jgi:hypothetical protein
LRATLLNLEGIGALEEHYITVWSGALFLLSQDTPDDDMTRDAVLPLHGDFGRLRDPRGKQASVVEEKCLLIGWCNKMDKRCTE